jgi:hypothetical protein
MLMAGGGTLWVLHPVLILLGFAGIFLAAGIKRVSFH